MWKAITILIIGILIADVGVMTFTYMQQGSQLRQAVANVSVMESQVNSLNGDLMILRGSVAILQSRLADSDSNTLALQKKLNAAEATATELQSVLAYTNTQYAKALAGPTPNLTITPVIQQVGPIDHGAGMGK